MKHAAHRPPPQITLSDTCPGYWSRLPLSQPTPPTYPPLNPSDSFQIPISCRIAAFLCLAGSLFGSLLMADIRTPGSVGTSNVTPRSFPPVTNPRRISQPPVSC